MKKFLLKNIHPDLVMILTYFWFITLLVTAMLGFEAYKPSIVQFFETHTLFYGILAMLALSLVSSWPLLRMYPYMKK